MGSLTVKAKISFLVAFSIAILGLVGVGGWLGIARVSVAMTQLGENQLPAVTALSDVRALQYALYAYTLETAMWEKEQYSQAHFKDILERKTAASAKLDTAWKNYEKAARTADEEKAWQMLGPGFKRWRDFDAQLTQIIADLGNADTPEAKTQLFEKYYGVVVDWKDAQYAVEKNLGKLVALNLKNGNEARQGGTKAKQTAVQFMIASFVVAAVILLLLGVFIARSIVIPLERMKRAIVRVAERNDFTIRAEVRGNDEAGQTTRAFNQLIEQMQHSLRDVLDNAARIADASHQASHASQQVLAASNSQSESASAIAAAVEEMTVSINHISDSTQDALHRAKDAGSAADTGASIISQTHNEMDQIAHTVKTASDTIDDMGRQSDKISGIMQVIKDVADQTNLLALNAAIEAARAGEQGRGFAVVADEVRKLAERTTHSTEEISKMVTGMQASVRNAVVSMESVVRQVTDGKDLSGQAAGRMGDIQHSASHVADAINDISAALNEQSSVAQDIARQVETVARMSEDNAVSAAKTSSLSNELDTFATALREVANRFKV